MNDVEKMIVQIVVFLSVISCLIGLGGFLVSTYSLVVFCGVLLGVFTRQMLPFIRKINEGKIEGGFNPKFLWTAIATLIYSTPIAVSLLATAPVIEQSLVITFFTAFLYGYGGQSLTNELLKYYEMLRTIYVKKKSMKKAAEVSS